MSIRHIKNIKTQPPINVIIPAAGMGKRMKSYGPKPLIKIAGNTTLLDNQIHLLKKYLDNPNIILVCGFGADEVFNTAPNDIIKIENENYMDTNVVRSIGMGLRACNNNYDTLIVYGDLVFNDLVIKDLDINNSSLPYGKNIMSNEEVGCIVNKKSHLEHIMYDLDHKWGQIVFLKGKELKLFKELCWEPNNYMLFGFEIINKVVDNGGSFLCKTNAKYKIIDIDTSKDLDKVKNII